MKERKKNRFSIRIFFKEKEFLEERKKNKYIEGSKVYLCVGDNKYKIPFISLPF